jgi:hypothetical protein
MPVGFTAYYGNAALEHLRGGAAFAQPAALFVKLHVDDPGASGVANAAGNTTRQPGTFGAAPSGGVMANTAELDWVAVSTTETYSHFSIWDAATGGNCLWTGIFTSPVPVAVGGTFTMTIGQLSLAYTLAS